MSETNQIMVQMLDHIPQNAKPHLQPPPPLCAETAISSRCPLGAEIDWVEPFVRLVWALGLGFGLHGLIPM